MGSFLDNERLSYDLGSGVADGGGQKARELFFASGNAVRLSSCSSLFYAEGEGNRRRVTEPLNSFKRAS
jgi:hypothetical protein